METEKILYEDQVKALTEASSYLLDLLRDKSCVKEAYIWGSLAEGKFGFYKKEHNGRFVSDIDLVIIVDESRNIPESWSYTKVEKSWFKLYDLGFFEYFGNKHPIDGLLVFPSKHDLNRMNYHLKNRSKRIV